MNKLLAAALTTTTLLLQGCLCGGYEGAGDQVMRRDNGDSMILCESGGYAAMLSDGRILEGTFSRSEAITAADGETGARAFTLAVDASGAVGAYTSPELGSGWAQVTLDQVELDHAHVQCTDLEARTWWASVAGSLPTDTAFTKGTEELLLCADSTIRSNRAIPGALGYYSARAGQITIYADGSRMSFDGVYSGTSLTAAATTYSEDAPETWTKVATTALTSGLRCE